jgi:ubiquinone/menaquinone biosynthesis C-methylase UbiE
MSFDYEAVTWGGGSVISPSAPNFLDHSLHLRYALEALKDVHGKVIEIGCGSGRFIASVGAARPDLSVYGCDVSETALEEAHKRPGLKVEKADALHLPYADKSFGGVLMIDVLEHLPDLDAGLAEVRRVLAPGGVFHLVFPCEGHPLTLYGWIPQLHRMKRKHAGHIQQLSPKALNLALVRAGFTVSTTRSSYHFLGQLYDIAVFSALELGVNMHGARQELVESGKRSVLSSVRSALSWLLFQEARLFAGSPLGMTVHVTAT